LRILAWQGSWPIESAYLHENMKLFKKTGHDTPSNKDPLCTMRRRTLYNRKHLLEAFLERSNWSTTRPKPSVLVTDPRAVQLGNNHDSLVPSLDELGRAVLM
jgi:hypothetical protein